MLEIKATPIEEKEEFNRAGYHYTRVWSDNDNKVYVYRLHHIEEEMPYYQFEVVKGVKRKGIYVYPSDEDFGTNGWYICGTAKKCNLKISEKLSYLSGSDVKFECEAYK